MPVCFLSPPTPLPFYLKTSLLFIRRKESRKWLEVKPSVCPRRQFLNWLSPRSWGCFVFWQSHAKIARSSGRRSAQFQRGSRKLTVASASFKSIVSGSEILQRCRADILVEGSLRIFSHRHSLPGEAPVRPLGRLERNVSSFRQGLWLFNCCVVLHIQ